MNHNERMDAYKRAMEPRISLVGERRVSLSYMQSAQSCAYVCYILGSLHNTKKKKKM